jgi:hypothetical protein
MLMTGMRDDLRLEGAFTLQIVFLLLHQLHKAHAAAALDLSVPAATARVNRAAAADHRTMTNRSMALIVTLGCRNR